MNIYEIVEQRAKDIEKEKKEKARLAKVIRFKKRRLSPKKKKK